MKTTEITKALEVLKDLRESYECGSAASLLILEAEAEVIKAENMASPSETVQFLAKAIQKFEEFPKE